MKPIVVVGSINMDLVVRTEEIPKLGETIMGTEMLQIPGGKGANQAVAISKLRNEVIFLGKIGNDEYGKTLLDSMQQVGINIDCIEKAECATGVAIVTLDKVGNNNIIVISGANGEVDVEYLNKNIEVFEKGNLILFQLEIPLESVKEGLKISKRLGKTTILNPAPAQELDDETIKNIDILIPNESELERLAGIRISNQESILKGANILIKRGIGQLIVTLGEKGVLYINKNGHKFFNAYQVNPVDTTAAGDGFIGGFISAFSNNGNIEDAINSGQKVAALAIQKLGAQTSLPTYEELDNFID